ncbi:hypothetical protein ABTZ93_27845 [Streptomyces sp. NPDC097941]|uniref:hypothetical protein n=1 Tax=Streptomyces sp. NPDC097941 TaxID=3155685 RepID=UPI0033296464
MAPLLSVSRVDLDPETDERLLGHPRFDVTAYNGGHQASAILRWEGENHDFTRPPSAPGAR